MSPSGPNPIRGYYTPIFPLINFPLYALLKQFKVKWNYCFSWEFLNENFNEEDPSVMHLSPEKIETPTENPYDNLPIKSQEDVEAEKQKGNKEKSECGTEELQTGKVFPK